VGRAVARPAAAAAGAAAAPARHGFREAGRVDSALPGPKGNREIFLRLLPEGGDPMFS
jgi:hypothetical protein